MMAGIGVELAPHIQFEVSYAHTELTDSRFPSLLFSTDTIVVLVSLR